MLSANHVTVYKNGKTVLEDISLEIEQGDFISLIGPNGAGKTTLLKTLLGIERPSQGQVMRRSGLKIGYMPQKLALDGLLPLTAERFLQLTHHAHSKITRSKQAVAALADEVGLHDILHKPLTGLSGGELQRVLLARALLGNPDILMLDEPVQNLDVHGQLQFYAQLESLYQKRGLTIVMVSHDLHMVMRATRKVVCLYKQICCAGTPDAVRDDPQFIELFGRDMSDMLKIYQHSHDHEHAS